MGHLQTENALKASKHFMSEEGNGKLRLYHLFPRNYNSMAEATADLDRVGQLGFNAIWISPLSPTSDLIVKRFNYITAEMQSVKNSLYAAIDFSQLNHNMFPDLTSPKEQVALVNGNPAHSTPHEREMMQAFTTKARQNGLQPLFDLVLNHVGSGSNLITGTCPYFVAEGIDTKKWFQGQYEKYDDVVLFNYYDPEVRDEIIRMLWIPFITKYINEFGFDGIRMDFAAARIDVREVEKILCQEINRLVAAKGTQPIIYAEVLPPAAKIEEHARNIRGLYSHVTNSALWGVDVTEHERGLKQQITHLMPDSNLRSLPGGTIGFAGSHDSGTNARNAVKSAAVIDIHQDDFKRHIFYQSPEKKQAHELESAITEQIKLARGSEAKMQECLLVARKRLASCALVSDGGWYLLGGDEFGKQAPASVFLDETGKSLYSDPVFFQEAKQQTKWHHTGLIQDINSAIAAMPRSSFPHWAKVLTLGAPHNHLVIVLNYNGEGFSDPKPFLTIVNVLGKSVQASDELIDQIAKEAEKTFSTRDAFESVLRSTIQLIGAFDLNVRKCEVNTYYHPEAIPLVISDDCLMGSRVVEDDPIVWEIDVQQAKSDIHLTEEQRQLFSLFKEKSKGNKISSTNQSSNGDDLEQEKPDALIVRAK